MKISPNAACPCHSGAKYKKCCRSYHDGTPAPTPEKLMRSRYSAYALHLHDYLMRKTHSTSPHRLASEASWRARLETFSRDTRFAGLEILAAEGDIVTFHAILFDSDRDISYIEHSLFAQEDGEWRYIKGVEK